MRVLQYQVSVDFDGTIAPDDPTDAMFEALADPYWQQVETEYQDGLLTSRECMQRQAKLLRCTPEEMTEFLDTRTIDPSFAEFVKVCQDQGARVVVVSDGFEQVAGHMLAKAGLQLDYFANRLRYHGDRSWTCQFPHASGACRSRMGNCKCSHQVLDHPAWQVMVGDGRSDFCIAEHSQFVLSKGALTDHCRDEGVPYVPFIDFADATAHIKEFFRRTEAMPDSRSVSVLRRLMQTSSKSRRSNNGAFDGR